MAEKKAQSTKLARPSGHSLSRLGSSGYIKIIPPRSEPKKDK